MKLEGDLQEIDVIRQLLDLADSRFTGALRLENDGIIKILYLKEGDLLSASTNDRNDSVDEILLRAGKVSRDHIRQALGKRKDNETLGDALLALGFIAKKELVWARRVQAVGIIRSIRDWSGGTWQLVQDYLPKREEGTLYYLPQILLELIVTDPDRASVEKRIDGGAPVFVKTPQFDERYRRLALNEDADRITAEIDGERSAAEIAAASQLETFAVYKLLLALETLGMLRRPKPQASLEVPAGGGAATVAMERELRVPPAEDDLSVHFGEETVGDPLSMPIEPAIPVDGASTAWDAADRSELEGDQVPAAPPEPPSHMRRRSSTNAILLLVTLIVALGAVAFFGYQWWSGRDAKAVAVPPPNPAPADQVEVVETPVQPLADEPLAAPAPVTPMPVATPQETPAPPPTSTVAAVPTTTAPTATTAAPAASADPLRTRYQSMAETFAAQNAAVDYTVQFEIVCETASVTRALQEGGTDVWFVPISFRGRPCFRVFWGKYDTREAADRAKSEIPPSLRGSEPAIVRPREILR